MTSRDDKPTCSICGEEAAEHNAWPFEGECCGTCNGMVIRARLALMQGCPQCGGKLRVAVIHRYPTVFCQKCALETPGSA